jgi:hypothetical protein
MSENDMVSEILERAANGDNIGNKLVYDQPSRSLRPSSSYDDPDKTIGLTNQDKHLWHPAGRMSR